MVKFYDVRLSDRKAGARQRCVNFSVEFCNGYRFTQLSLPSLLNYICPLVYNRFVYKQWQRSIRPYTCTSVTEFKNRSSSTSIAQYRESIRHQQQIVKTFNHLFPSYSTRKTYLSTADPFVISVVFHHPVDLRSHNSFFASTLQPIRPTPQTFGFAYALCVRAFHQSPPSTPTSPSRPLNKFRNTRSRCPAHTVPSSFTYSFTHSFPPCSSMPPPNNATTSRPQNALGNARATSLTLIQACSRNALRGYTDGILNARTLNRLRTATAMRCGGTFLRGTTLAANRPAQKARKIRGRLHRVGMPGPSRVVMVT